MYGPRVRYVGLARSGQSSDRQTREETCHSLHVVYVICMHMIKRKRWEPAAYIVYPHTQFAKRSVRGLHHPFGTAEELWHRHLSYMYQIRSASCPGKR